MNNNNDNNILIFLVGLVAFAIVYNIYLSLSSSEKLLFIVAVLGIAIIGLIYVCENYSKAGRERQKRLGFIRELPLTLIQKSDRGVELGVDLELGAKIFLPDSIRSRHIHIIGATGSGKTESVILNFLKQDVSRGIGSIILDAKGDNSFLSALQNWVPEQNLKVFDLGSKDSLSYNPIEAGSPIEAAQRLFSSLTWSEEYYKSKAFSAVQRLFQHHFETHDCNPKLSDLDKYLQDPKTFSAFIQTEAYPQALAEKEFAELSGLRDQIKILNIGHMAKILSPKGPAGISLDDASRGDVIYFRLQSLMSPQLVSILGRLLINHLNYLAGIAHRSKEAPNRCKFTPTYLDEFASFACPEFAQLISKARSAGLALHFSHQSIGDLVDVSDGFINQITDNSATKIVLRINDPDSAEFFSRAFGTKRYQKVTQRITNVKEIEKAEVVGEGTQREAHQFRASPDLFKTLPTGTGSVLIAHGFDTPHGASSVFKIKFPKLEQKENQI